jgi:hypothetical protein
MSDIFASVRWARQLREREPEAGPQHALLLLVMATYADGDTGGSIRPTLDRLASETGLHRRNVTKLVRWLEDHGEIQRVKEGHRGSAAMFRLRLEKDEPAAQPFGERMSQADGKDEPLAQPTNQTSHSSSGPSGPPEAGPGAMCRADGCRAKAVQGSTSLWAWQYCRKHGEENW